MEYKGSTSWLYSLPKPQQEFSRQEEKFLVQKYGCMKTCVGLNRENTFGAS